MKKFFLFATALLMSASMFAEGSVFTYQATAKLERQFKALGTVATHEFNDGNGKVTYSETVTTIGDMAFATCTALQSITIPASVTTIGKMAFYKTGLTSITIPAGVTEIGNSVFYGCSALQSVTIPAGVTTIGKDAFSGCSALQSITLPASVTTLGEEVFMGSGLTSVTIPAGVTTIEGYALGYCSALASVTFLGNACQDNIGESAFYNVGNPDPALLTLPDSWTGSKPDEEGNWYEGKFKLNDTALPQMRAAVKATKVLTNGQVIFRAENKNFSILGQEVR